MIDSAASTLAIVYNPRAGGLLRRRRRFDEAAGLLRGVWRDVRLIETEGPRSAGRLAREAAEGGVDLVVACGGDGTINEIAQSLSGTGVPLGILPGGTANVLANEVGIGNDMVRAARMLETSEPHDVATGVVRQGAGATRFILMAGLGFDALLVHELDRATKERAGKRAYWGAAIRELGRRLEELDLSVDGKTIRGTFAIISRVRNYGGDFEIARGASLLADDFEVVVFRTRSVVRLAWILLGGAVTRSFHGRRDVAIVRGRKIEASAVSAPVRVQVDGEAAGELPATIELVPASMRLMLPREWVAKERARLRVSR